MIEGVFDFIVSDHFEYKGRGGRLSQKVTSQRFGSGTRAFASNYSFNELGQPEVIAYPVCLEWPCENKAPQRTVHLSYTKGFLTEVENFADLSYQLGGGMVHEINHSNGVKWTQTINTSDRQPRPSSIGTSGVAGGANWSTGTYDFDGAWNIHQIGSAQFRYDRFHRLVQGQVDFGGLKNQSATYDSYGNLTSLTTNGSTQSLSPSSTTNRLTGGTTTYDAAGNNTKLVLGGITYEYGFDASGQMEFLKSSANQAKVFFYDAADERLMTWDCPLNSCGENSALETWTLRGLGAEVLRVFEGKSSDTLTWKEDYVHRGSKTLAAVRPTATGGEETFAIHLDHLGSTRQVTNSAGAEVERHHFYPFGEEATVAQVPDVRLKYTGHERDRNGGGKGQLDYMHARSNSPVTGRFLSPDPVLQQKRAVRKPVLWNRYAYSANNPAKYIDPTGRVLELPSECADRNGCRALRELRNTVPVTLRIFVRAQVVGDKVVLDARYLNMMKNSASGNFQALRQIANSPGNARFTAGVKEVQWNGGGEPIGEGEVTAGVTLTGSQSLSGDVEIYSGAGLGALEAAQTTAHEVRHGLRMLLGQAAQHEVIFTYNSRPGGDEMVITLDPNGPVNSETRSAEQEALRNYDPFIPPQQ